MDNAGTIWQSALSLLKNELNVSELTYNTWFSPIKPICLMGNKLVLEVPNPLYINIINKNYYPDLAGAVKMATAGSNTEVELVTSAERDRYTAAIAEQPEKSANPTLNPKYTFDTFVIGNGNRFAHAAALAVAEDPAHDTNPLFIYGGAGLGKTHLLHAIGNYVLSQNPKKKVLYVTCEKFTNDLINSIKTRKNEEFRTKYRNADILMIDDIQFLAGKDSTQEEIFHTFNDLHSANRQIVISSDKHPKHIATLEERLRSRFEWGLIADIAPPDIETRVAILRNKAEADRISVDNDVIMYIAEKIDSNIRELEGSLTRVIMFSTISGKSMNLELAKEALKDFFPSREKKINAAFIMETVAKFYNIRPEDFSAKRRDKLISAPRQIAMYLCREMTDLSLPRIGETFGGRDHSTVIHAINKIYDCIQQDRSLANEINDLKKRIQGL